MERINRKHFLMLKMDNSSHHTTKSEEVLKTSRQASILQFWKEGRSREFFLKYGGEELLSSGIPKEDLLQAGVIHGDGTGDLNKPLPPDCNSMAEVARAIAVYFNVDVRPGTVRAWKAGLRLPKDAPPFPVPCPESHQYKAVHFIPWYKDHLMDANKKHRSDMLLSSELAQEEDKNRIEEIRHDRWKRDREQGKYIAIDQVKACVLGLSMQDAGKMDRLIEDRDGLRKIVQIQGMACGISSDLLSELDSRLEDEFAKANDKIKSEYEDSYREMVKQLKSDKE